MEVSVVSGFWLVTSALLIMAFVLDQLPAVPNLWRSLFRWGKMRVGVVKGSKQFFEVPKRWFQHFYVVGVAVNSALLWLLVQRVCLGESWPLPLSSLVARLQSPVDYKGVDSAVPVFLVLGMEWLQVSRRCYETFRVNVFSRTATMTLLHYGLGLVFYLSIGVCVLAGCDFQRIQLTDAVTPSDLAVYSAAILLFLSASLLQHRSFKILAALRTNAKGKAEKNGYQLPEGGLFDQVSCPHFLAEVLIYLSFCLVFRLQHTVLLSLFGFVLVNQVLAALLTHQWYCKRFRSYGRTRRAIFPYLL